MHPRWLYLIPAFLLLSCDESKAPTEPTVDEQAQPELSVASTHNNHHPRTQAGQKIRCFTGGSEGTIYGGFCKRASTNDEAEVNTMGGDPDGEYAGVYPAENRIKGKLLTRVRELDFIYAGGPQAGGVPRFSIPIDCVQGARAVGTDGEVYPPSQCQTDGNYDYFVFIDANGCNDGDVYVGTIEGDDNPNCLVTPNHPELAGAPSYPNWAAFVAAHPGGKIARDQITFIVIDQPAHYIIWKVDVR